MEQLDISELIKEFGIDKLPPEEQDAILERLFESVNLRVGMRMSEALSDEEMKRIGELGQSDDQEYALGEIEKIYPDFRKAYQEELDKLREEMRAHMPSEEELARMEAEAREGNQNHEQSNNAEQQPPEQ